MHSITANQKDHLQHELHKQFPREKVRIATISSFTFDYVYYDLKKIVVPRKKMFKVSNASIPLEDVDKYPILLGEAHRHLFLEDFLEEVKEDFNETEQNSSFVKDFVVYKKYFRNPFKTVNAKEQTIVYYQDILITGYVLSL